MQNEISYTGKIWEEIHEFSESESLFSNFLASQKKQRNDFNTPKFSDFLSPFEFSNMEKCCERVKESIKTQERILIFGDYDADGMTGTAQLYLTLKSIGANVSYRLPSRQDGYGLNEKFIHEASEKEVKLFITTDCGISNYTEVELAKSLGIDVIITDHHSVPGKIPKTPFILHPLVKTEEFPDKNLTGAGVSWCFCLGILQTILGKEKAQTLAEKLLEIAVIGTIADCGVLTGENRKISILGLQELEKTRHFGLKELIKKSGTNPQKITAETVGFFLAPRLNASGRIAHPRISLELLLGDATKAQILEELNQERQEMVESFLEEATEQVASQQDSPCIILSSDHWPAGVIGLISGKLAEKYSRPVITFETSEEKFVGSCRGPEDFHIANTLKEIKSDYPEFFLGCGGHAQAAGLSLYPQYFSDFCAIYAQKVEEKRGKKIPSPSVHFMGTVSRNIHTKEVEELSIAQPFGIGNPSPVFCFSQMEVKKIRGVGNGKKHLSLFLQSDYGEFFSGIFFNQSALLEKISEGSKISVLAIPEINEWKDQKNISLKIQDIKRV